MKNKQNNKRLRKYMVKMMENTLICEDELV